MIEQKKAKPSLFLIIILGLLTAFGPFSIDMYLPALPEISNDFNTSTSNTQLTLTLFMIGLAIGQVFVGPLSDFIGRKKPLMVALVVYTIRSEEHTSELQSRFDLVCRLLLEKKKK